ncbi:hypothetical protein [Bosea sp. UNC402CLCol]|uniref:hypothetical protein n=1 Tax=Bosea sp. UNC402CLCol TaxID=1510531 RepID=UPI0012E01D5E|nr:hypothetical protein [Bosea sp. UNC402CLCol]
MEPCGIDLKSYLADPRTNAEAQRKIYQANPYLANISQDLLNQRYRELRRNISTLVGPERDNGPVESVLSSWYWLRKLVHTEEEYSRRQVPAPPFTLPFDAHLLQIKPPVSPPFPNKCNFLVRYGKASWLNDMLQSGRVRVKPAAQYADDGMNDARRDDEINYHWFQNANRVRVSTPDGRRLYPVGDVRHTSSLSGGYYTLCTSSECDLTLFPAFDADACLIIHDVETFSKRLEAAFAPFIQSLLFVHVPVEYSDPYEWGPKSVHLPGVTKHFRYAYQKEYRFLWLPRISAPPLVEVEAFVGSMSGIARLYSFEELSIRR